MIRRPIPFLLACLAIFAARDALGGPAMDFSTLLQPVPATAIFEQPGYYVWCGSLVRSDDGMYQLFYSRWPKRLGFNAWVTSSEIARAVGPTPLGPFKFKDVVLPARGAQYWDGLCTHNPTVHRFGKRYYLYYMGNTGDGKVTANLNFTHRNNQRIGVAVADRPEGPWMRSDRPLIDVTAHSPDALCLNNPSIAEMPDGRYLMVYKAVGNKNPLPFGGPVVHLAAIAKAPEGPFTKYPKPLFTKQGVPFAAEDPFIWCQDGRYWAIVKDMKGYFTGAGRSLALFESDNGLDWRPAAHPLVAKTEIRLADGTLLELHALERPQLFFRDGKPAVLLCAADIDEKHSRTFNVQIPLKDARSAADKK